MIDGVKGFKPKFNLLLFMDRENPADGHVDVQRARCTQEVPPNVAEAEDPIREAGRRTGKSSLVKDYITLRGPCRVARLPFVDVERLPWDDVGPVVALIGEGSIRT